MYNMEEIKKEFQELNHKKGWSAEDFDRYSELLHIMCQDSMKKYGFIK